MKCKCWLFLIILFYWFNLTFFFKNVQWLVMHSMISFDHFKFDTWLLFYKFTYQISTKYLYCNLYQVFTMQNVYCNSSMFLNNKIIKYSRFIWVGLFLKMKLTKYLPHTCNQYCFLLVSIEATTNEISNIKLFFYFYNGLAIFWTQDLLNMKYNRRYIRRIWNSILKLKYFFWITGT